MFAMGFAEKVKACWSIMRGAGAVVFAKDAAPPKPEGPSRVASAAAAAHMRGLGEAPREAWTKPEKPYWLKDHAKGTLAMDSAMFDRAAEWAAQSSPWSEGLGFLGYAYLAELTQRPEYRRISEIWAAECTRKWVRITGEDKERVAKLEQEMLAFGVREKFREMVEIDGFFGRSHLFVELEGEKDEELKNPLAVSDKTVVKGCLKNLKVVEPFWVYPMMFNSTNPLKDDFYAPTQWQVMANLVSNTRLLTIVGRELPDILKPMYMFGGLSLSQIAKPYIDNFLRNRSSIGNLLYSFSIMVLSTNMAAMIAPGGAAAMLDRADLFTLARDNNGVMFVDKDTEELTNVSAPLSGTDKLLAQAQEQISSVVGIPLVVLLGTSPTGLNASSEGELKAFYANILGYQERAIGPVLEYLLPIMQLNMDGKLDPTINYEFVDLWELDDEARARIRQTDAQIDCEYVDRGIIDGEAVRERVKKDTNSPYYGVDLVPGEPLAQPQMKDEGDPVDEEGEEVDREAEGNTRGQ